MKNKLLILVLFALTILVLTNCKKFGKTFDTYFYTDIENTAGPLYLYVDGKSKGELPNLKTSLSPSNDTIINNALHLRLRSGKYKIEGKDNQGNVKVSGYIKFRTNSVGNGGTMGGLGSSSSDKVIVNKLNY